MLHFVAVGGSPDAVERVVPRLDRALDATRIVEGERVSAVGARRTWAMAAEVVRDPVCPERVALSPDGFALVNGPATSAVGEQHRVASSVLEAARTGGSAGVASVLGSTYNVVWSTPATGLAAFTDFSGMYAIYWAQLPDLVVVSNRPSTIAAVAGRSDWYLPALRRLIAYRNLFGERVPHAGVAKLPPGRELRVRSGATVPRFVPSPTWVWPSAGASDLVDQLAPADWDAITDELVTAMRAAAPEGPLRLQLTGGKDSRLLLSVAIAAGLRDRISTITNGAEDNPEVHAAAAVAKAAGVPHARIGPPPGSAPPSTADRPAFDGPACWRRIRQQVFRFDGIVCPWDGITDPLHGQGVTMKGFGGELYRQPPTLAGGVDAEAEQDLEVLAAAFAGGFRAIDPLEVVRPEHLALDAGELITWFRQSAAEVPAVHLPERHYVENQLGHWTGPLAQCVPTRVSLTPLLSSSVARRNLRLVASQRAADRLHYEVMRRAAPEVVGVPFLADRWAEEIAADAPAPLPRAPIVTPVAPPTGCREVSSSGSRSPARSSPIPRCCCSTRSPRRSTPNWWARCSARSGISPPGA